MLASYVSYERVQNSRVFITIIANTAANWFWGVSGLIPGQPGTFGDEEVGAYDKE
jgi:hypothetical protein